LCHSLILQQFYSTIFAVSCPEETEGFSNSTWQVIYVTDKIFFEATFLPHSFVQ